MPSEGRLTFRFRLEDALALAFFLISLALRIIFRQIQHENLSPADVLVIMPAITLLLARELAHYFIAAKEMRLESGGSLRQFARPYWEIARDWSSFLVILLMYYSLWGDATHLLVTTDRDAALIAWDQRLFGVQASLALERFIRPSLTAWMQFAYFFHVLNVPVVACFIYTRRPKWRFREMMFGLVLVTFWGLIGYLLVPGVGPLFALRHRYTVPLTQPLAIFNQQMEFMDFARIRRDVFPSLHVGISFLVWLYAYRNSRRLSWVLAPFVLSLWVSTIYLRYHYLVDDLAGLILAPLCFWLANRLFARFGEIAFPLTLPLARAGILEHPESPKPVPDPGSKLENQP